MKPTPKLQFVERKSFIEVVNPQTLRILQQWWETSNTINLGFGGEMPLGETKGEWRDVPIEKKQT